MSTKEGLVAPAFCALIMRNVSPTTVERESGVWPGVVSRSARGAVGRWERLGVEVIPYGHVWGEVDRWLSRSGKIGAGRVWGGWPECGNGNAAPLGGVEAYSIRRVS
jgi:hypothetical protein